MIYANLLDTIGLTPILLKVVSLLSAAQNK